MTNLFLDGIFSKSKSTLPNQVEIYIPIWNQSSGKSETDMYRPLVGLLTSEFTLSSQNKWGPILGDVSDLRDLSSLLGSQEIFSWIGASVQCWKGTEPLKFSLDFYLINYKPKLGLEARISELVKLTSLSQSNSGITSVAKVAPHGGYAADVLSTNKQYFNNSKWSDITGNTELFQGLATTDLKGTVTVKVGSRISISNLLVSRVDVTPSLVEVIGQTDKNPKPLYYRVSTSFVGVKPLLSTDVENIYGNI